MAFNERSEQARRRVLRPWGFRLYLWGKVPLAAFAGLRVVSLDSETCTVALPGGWRTQNPFSSTYFAAQAMAAEMTTGAAAMVLVQGAPGSVALILREVKAVYTKRIQGPSLFTFSDIAGMQAVVERAAAGGDGESYTGRVTGRTHDGQAASEFEITWSFKRRS